MKDKEGKNMVKENPEEKLLCPFNPNLACEDCRLYIKFAGGRGEKTCVFKTVT